MQTTSATFPARLPRRRPVLAPIGRSDVRPTHLRPTRLGRVLITVLAFVAGLVVAAVLLLAFEVPAALAGGAERTVVVTEGQTLWSLAESHAPEGVSTAEYVSELRSENQVPTGRLTAGQEIVLPEIEG